MDQARAKYNSKTSNILPVLTLSFWEVSRYFYGTDTSLSQPLDLMEMYLKMASNDKDGDRYLKMYQ